MKDETKQYYTEYVRYKYDYAILDKAYVFYSYVYETVYVAELGRSGVARKAINFFHLN